MQQSYRIARDSLGEVKVPEEAYYGAQTQRAVHNFPISGLRLPRPFIRAQGLIKAACARANWETGGLEERVAKAIIQAPEEVIEVMRDMREHGIDMLTIGQYLAPSNAHLPVRRYVHPDVFRMFEERANEMGFTHAAVGAMVRSSYHADPPAHAAGVA